MLTHERPGPKHLFKKPAFSPPCVPGGSTFIATETVPSRRRYYRRHDATKCATAITETSPLLSGVIG